MKSNDEVPFPINQHSPKIGTECCGICVNSFAANSSWLEMRSFNIHCRVDTFFPTARVRWVYMPPCEKFARSEEKVSLWKKAASEAEEVALAKQFEESCETLW